MIRPLVLALGAALLLGPAAVPSAPMAPSAYAASTVGSGQPGTPAPASARTSAGVPGRTATPSLGTGVVLFVDGHRIGSTRNLARQYVQGRKWEVPGLPVGMVDLPGVYRYLGEDPADDALDGDADVDSEYLRMVTSVMREEVDGKPLYRMWLRSGMHTGYRESHDGVHWHVRDADSVIVVPDVTGVSVVKGAGTGLYYLFGWSRKAAGYVEMVSTNGVDFRRTNTFTGLLSELYGDVIQAESDPVTGHMYAMAKQGSERGVACKTSPMTRSGGRAYGTHVSTAPAPDDEESARGPLARAWSLPGTSPVLMADCVDALSVPPLAGTVRPAQIYGMPFQRYGDQYLGFPWFYRLTKLPPSKELSGWSDGPVDTQIASTPDLMRVPWQRSEPTVSYGRWRQRPVLIPRGRPNTWDDGMLYGHGRIVDVGGRSVMYYTGWNDTHYPTNARRSRIGAASWAKDRFVGLRVVDPQRLALLRTRPFHLPAAAGERHLRVNVALRPGRWLRVAVVDTRTNRVVPGFDFQDSTIVRGDHTSARVTWQGRNLGALRNRPIRLAIQYGAGSLYAFTVS